MRCSKVKKLLLTGYTDGELSQHLKEKVAAHLDRCEKCRALESTMLSSAVMPFRNAEKPEVPEELWHRIKREVIQDEPESATDLLLRRLSFRTRRAEFPRRPAFAFATVMVLVIGLVFAGAYHNRRERALSYFIDDQSSFLHSLDDFNETSPDDIGIPMEEIFM
jgi:anti-sigma factor RsiW